GAGATGVLERHQESPAQKRSDLLVGLEQRVPIALANLADRVEYAEDQGSPGHVQSVARPLRCAKSHRSDRGDARGDSAKPAAQPPSRPRGKPGSRSASSVPSGRKPTSQATMSRTATTPTGRPSPSTSGTWR